jgi:SAM-dependent methyltransferase
MVGDPIFSTNRKSEPVSSSGISTGEETRLKAAFVVSRFLAAFRRMCGRLKGEADQTNRSGGINLEGDRDIEWSWVSSQIPSGPGEALDFGPGGSHLGLIAARKGLNVVAVDLQPVHCAYKHPGVRFLEGDILDIELPKDHFDVILNCSTVEHVGLTGRYGVINLRPEGDMAAMERLRQFMRTDGTMLLTIPIGQDAVFAPLHRVYGPVRLPKLLKNFFVEKEEYWVKDPQNRWVLGDKEEALARKPLEKLYGLGCFMLRKPRI